MLTRSWRTAALGLSASAVLGLAGCGAPPAEQAPPPPMASNDAPPPSPELAGGPAPEQQPMAPPPQSAPIYEAAMPPIPNPEDLSPEERTRLYGHRYDHEVATARVGHRVHAHLRPAYAEARTVRHRAAARPITAQTPVSRPVAPAAKPAPAPAARATASTTDRLTQLQSDLAGPVAQGAVLVVSDDIAAGKTGTVSLSLPADLLAQIRTAAAKHDLGQSAAKVEIHAALTGDGYSITPSGDQVAQPQLGEVINFTWQVQPMAGATAGPLTAQVVADLNGAAESKTVPLLSLQKAVKPAAAADAATTAAATPAKTGLEALNAKLGAIEIPGLGKIAVSFLIAIGLLILIGVALVMSARHQAERERERRRRLRAESAARFDEQVAAARASGPFTTVDERPREPIL